MREYIWSNPEFRRGIIQSAVLVIFFTLIMLICSHFFWESLNENSIERDMSIIGDLIEHHPELQDDIVPAFTQQANIKSYKKGIEVAGRFGYDKKLPIDMSPVLVQYSTKSYWGIIIFSVFCFSGLIFIFFIVLRGLYLRIRETARAAERIVEGDFSNMLCEENEGDYAKLGHQFNAMAKRLQLSIEELQSEKLFLKNTIFDISHQLKTPLASIKVFNELLEDELTDDDPDNKRKFIQMTASQIQRMEWLIKYLLIIARIEVGAIEFHRINQSLNHTLCEVYESLKLKWAEKELAVNLICQSEIMLFHDREWIGEALSNIIKNSIEHTNKGGKIDIELFETSVMVRIKISDNGEGICEEDLPHIFERFYKGKNNIHGNGTGIGLALAKSIIEGHDGIIRADSVLGEGTEFTITFPKMIV